MCVCGQWSPHDNADYNDETFSRRASSFVAKGQQCPTLCGRWSHLINTRLEGLKTFRMDLYLHRVTRKQNIFTNAITNLGRRIASDTPLYTALHVLWNSHQVNLYCVCFFNLVKRDEQLKPYTTTQNRFGYWETFGFGNRKKVWEATRFSWKTIQNFNMFITFSI
jgi:hypothetical protein